MTAVMDYDQNRKVWLVLSSEKKALAQGVVGSGVVSHWSKK